MRWPWRRQTDESVALVRASRRPWDAAAFTVVLGVFALLSLAGVWRPPSTLLWFAPMVVAVVATLAVMLATRERSLTLAERDDHVFLVSAGDGAVQQIRLDEVAFVSREQPGEPPAITVMDLAGQTMHIPLGVWRNEAKLMAALRDAISTSGATGDVGADVAVPSTRVSDGLRALLTALAFACIIALVRAAPDDGLAVTPVTVERLRATRGDVYSPFFPRRDCDIFVIPLDGPSESAVGSLAGHLRSAVPASVCATRSIIITEDAVSSERSQLDGSIVFRGLRDQVYGLWGDRPITTIGVTDLDLFSPDRPDWRFVFGSRITLVSRQNYAVISTARMGSGGEMRRRLATMSLRYVGFGHYGLPESGDTSSALYPTILGLGDLDRMRPQLGQPPPTASELEAARERYLAAG